MAGTPVMVGHGWIMVVKIMVFRVVFMVAMVVGDDSSSHMVMMVVEMVRSMMASVENAGFHGGWVDQRWMVVDGQ